MELRFEKESFSKRLAWLVRADLRRMFTTRFLWILLGVCAVMPVLMLTMTTMFGGDSTSAQPSPDTFSNTWQAISAPSTAGMSMGLPGMCNLNMMYFAVAVLVCTFVSADFNSGYAKNLFTARPTKSLYVASKTLVCLLGGACMIAAFALGSVLGGAIAGLSFDLGGLHAGNVIMCLISKVLLMGVFVPIHLALSTVAKQRTWLSITLSLVIGMLLFMMIPMLTPLDATIANVIGCLIGALIFSLGLGIVCSSIPQPVSEMLTTT